MIATPRDLLPGEPHCAPMPIVLVEAYIHLIRSLHMSDQWNRQVSDMSVS